MELAPFMSIVKIVLLKARLLLNHQKKPGHCGTKGAVKMNRVLTDKEVDDLLASLSGGTYHKPCPFCQAQSQETRVVFLNPLYEVVCDICGAAEPKGYTTEDAERLWNER